MKERRAHEFTLTVDAGAERIGKDDSINERREIAALG